MPEILTESFCERCGTRYTFESAAPRAARLKGLKVLSRAAKNFVMSDDTSIDEIDMLAGLDGRDDGGRHLPNRGRCVQQNASEHPDRLLRDQR